MRLKLKLTFDANTAKAGSTNSIPMVKSIFILLSLATTAGAQSIPLEILEPKERTGTVTEFPVSVGMIFLDGEIPEAPGGAVVDDLGESIPFDWEVTGWSNPEKTSVKWLLLHFKASSDRKYSFVVGQDPVRSEGRPLAVEADGGISVDTGQLMARLQSGNAPVFESVTLNGTPMLEAGKSFFEMVDDEGRALSCEDWSLTLEETRSCAPLFGRRERLDWRVRRHWRRSRCAISSLPGRVCQDVSLVRLDAAEPGVWRELHQCQAASADRRAEGGSIGAFAQAEW